MRASIAVGMFALGCALGCAGGEKVLDMVPTEAGYQAQLDSYTGRSIKVAVLEMGAQTKVVDLPDGYKQYVWEEKSALETPVMAAGQSGPNGEAVVVHKGTRVPLDCTTNLQVDANSVVVGNSFKGLRCVGYAPTGTAAVAATPAPAAPAVAAPPPAALAGGTGASAAPAVPAAVSPPAEAATAPADEGDAATDEGETPREERRRLRRARAQRERRQE